MLILDPPGYLIPAEPASSDASLRSCFSSFGVLQVLSALDLLFERTIGSESITAAAFATSRQPINVLGGETNVAGRLRQMTYGP